MGTIGKNVLAVILGLVLGSAVNIALILSGASAIPPPEGVDPTNAESIRESLHLFGPKHFISPFLAHALGTLVGALVAWLVAGSQRDVLAYVVGAFFLAGGISASFQIPAPAWFVVSDLLLAYLPMAWIATRLGRRLKG